MGEHCEFILSERGAQIAVVNRFKYYKSDFVKSVDAYKWRCVMKTCVAKLYILENSSTVLKREGTHSHDQVSEVKILKDTVSNSVKRKAAGDLCDRPSKVIRNEIVEHDAVKQLTRKDVRCISLNVYRARRKRYPRLPQNINEPMLALVDLENCAEIASDSDRTTNGYPKRERASNFTPDESAHLLSVIEYGFLDIVENKKTDAVTTLAKNEAWRKITEAFNASGLGPPREEKSLKAKYDTIKRNLRKGDTGGGPYVPEVRLTEGEVILRDRIALSVRGLEPHPNDTNAGFSRGVVEESQMVLEDVKEEISDLEDVSANMLQTPVDPALRERNGSPGFIISRPNSPVAIGSTSASNRDGTPLGNDLSSPVPAPFQNGNTSRRRHVFKKKKIVSSVTGKYEELAEHKIRLVISKQQIVDLAKEQAELDKQQAEFAKQRAHFECQRAEVELRRAEVELQKSKLELRKMMRDDFPNHDLSSP